MQTSRKVELLHYDGARLPYRIAVGDVIRCPAFASCFLFNKAIRSLSGRLWVWRGSASDSAYRQRNGEGSANVETARAQTKFLVEQIKMSVGDGPHDVYPNQYRMSRDVSCLRLTEDYCLPQETEQICFSLNEFMSLCGIEEAELELLGYAKLPLVWEET